MNRPRHLHGAVLFLSLSTLWHGGIFVLSGFVLSRDEHEKDKGESAIEQEKFVAESVAPQSRREEVKKSAHHGAQQHASGHPALSDLPAGKEPEGVEPKQRSVGVGSQDIDGVDDAVVADDAERNATTTEA